MQDLEPAKCRGKLRESMWNDENYGAEFKFHGCRYLNHDGIHFLSRHISVKGGYVDKSLSLPHLMVPKMKGTILDGEIILNLFGTVRDVTSILGSAPDLALLKQRERGYLHYMIFDLPYYKNNDMRFFSLAHRKEILRDLIETVNNEHYHYVDYKIDGKRELYNSIVKRGGEGIILKEIYSQYGERSKWIKVKKSETWDVFITGFLEPSSESEKVDGTISVTRYKEKGWIGSICIGMVGNLDCGSVSGMDESVRAMVSKNPSKYVGRVIEIEAQSQLPSGKFEHPRFIRFRDDKRKEECLYVK